VRVAASSSENCTPTTSVVAAAWPNAPSDLATIGGDDDNLTANIDLAGLSQPASH
jgi:hypothetical protein